MKKIVFGITSLNLGGAERVLIDVTNKLKDKYDITIFTLYGNGDLQNEVDKNIKIVSLYNKPYEKQGSLKKKIIPLYLLIFGNSVYKKYIKNKFDVEVAFLEGAITRIFANGENPNKIVWVHNDISKVFGENKKAKLKLKIDQKTYKKYKRIIFVSNSNKDTFNKVFKGLESRQEVIYNYIDKSRIIKMSKQEVGQEYIEKNIPSILTVTRLTKQKATDRLIKVHKRLIDEGLKHNIYVIGDGPEKGNLEKQIKELHLDETFKLMGKRINPYPYVKRADYFALLSNFEGYPMTLEEAKILGKNIIITNTSSKEAVKNYSNKIILENTEDAIYEGLKQILQKNVVFEENSQEYDNEYLIEKIENLLDK